MPLKIYFLLVLPLLTKQSNINITENCKNLKCPNQEDSACVKVTYRKGLKNIGFNVIVYNKCEIGYIKCHPGLKAYVIPMRNCHSNNETTIQRSKREIKKGIRTFHKIGHSKKVYLYGDNLSESSSDDAKIYPKQKVIMNLNKKNKKEKQENEEIDSHDDETINSKDDKTIEDETARMDSTEALVKLNSRSREKHITMPNEEHDDKDKEDDRPDSVNVIDEEQVDSLDGTLNPNDGKEANEDNDSYEKSDGKVVQIRIDSNSGEKKPEFNDDVKVAKDYDLIEENDADLLEDNKDCPSTCALRDMMVCARCNHGVYRTFMSVCHLRAFLCTHTEEKLSLVSRLPCIQSAPFLSDLPPSNGRVHEPSGNDRVLQFIRCRAEGRLDKSDPKCNFNR